jgi:hypothetical protein
MTFLLSFLAFRLAQILRLGWVLRSEADMVG